MSDGMGREPAYLSSHATNRYFIPNWGNVTLLHCYIYDFNTHIETLKYMTSPTNQSIGTVGDEKAIGQS